MGTPRNEGATPWSATDETVGSMDALATLLGGREHFGRARALLSEHLGLRNFVKNVRIGIEGISPREKELIEAAALFGFAWGTAPGEVSKLDRPDAIASTYRRLVTDDSESLIVVGLSPSKLSVGEHKIVGGPCGVHVSVSQVLRAVLVLGADHFVLVHNHPSGNPAPSPQDIRLTRAVQKGADLVGLQLIDHVIVARSGFTSLRAECVVT